MTKLKELKTEKRRVSFTNLKSPSCDQFFKSPKCPFFSLATYPLEIAVTYN